MLDIVRPSEADALIAEGVIDSVKDIDRITEVGAKVLGHICNERCKSKTIYFLFSSGLMNPSFILSFRSKIVLDYNNTLRFYKILF